MASAITLRQTTSPRQEAIARSHKGKLLINKKGETQNNFNDKLVQINEAYITF